jgi:hypothetical protein
VDTSEKKHIQIDIPEEDCKEVEDLKEKLKRDKDTIKEAFASYQDRATFAYLKFASSFEKCGIARPDIESMLAEYDLNTKPKSGSGIAPIFDIIKKLKEKGESGICDVKWRECKNPSNTNSDNENKPPLQQIIYGAPGTGKSHYIKTELKDVPVDNKFRTTFHPDSDYSTFVGAYKPTTKGPDKSIEYGFVPQTFLQAYIRAYQTQEPVYLIIEEINRGNCAQIFGDLFQLLDRDESGKSVYPIKADADLCAYLKSYGENNEIINNGELCLPGNLHIWATMNTSDQSLFPIDSAFKRRWEWKYMPITYCNESWNIMIGEKAYKWTEFQKIINKKIFDIDKSEDKQLGDFFEKADNKNIISRDVFLNKILFYLWNDVCKDGEGEIFKIKKDNKDEDIRFSNFFEDSSETNGKLQGMMEFLRKQGTPNNPEREK